MSKKILIIDDNHVFRELVSTALYDSLSDITIDEARDGYLGERKLNIKRYNLILLDYKLPFGMDGLRFLERTIKQRSSVPLIMMTGQGDEYVAAKAFRMGVTDYLVKGSNLLVKLIGIAKDILEREETPNNTESRQMSATLNTANSGIELVKMYQEELNNLDTLTALKGDTLMLEFDRIEEFNRFSRLVKFIRGVNIRNTKILDDKYVLLLSLCSTRYQRIRSSTA